LRSIDKPIGVSSYRVTRELPAPIRKEGVLDDCAAMALAEQQPDRWGISRGAYPVIDGREIEVEFAGPLRFEGAGLQLDHEETLQPNVIEEQIEVEALSCYLQWNLAAHKGEAAA
jgi:hypothetical protein